MNHPNKIYSRDKLLHEVWGADYPGMRTVDVHIRRMREKIETNQASLNIYILNGESVITLTLKNKFKWIKSLRTQSFVYFCWWAFCPW